MCSSSPIEKTKWSVSKLAHLHALLIWTIGLSLAPNKQNYSMANGLAFGACLVTLFLALFSSATTGVTLN